MLRLNPGSYASARPLMLQIPCLFINWTMSPLQGLVVSLPEGIRQEMSFGWETITVAPHSLLRWPGWAKPTGLPVVFTGPATTTCSLQVNNVSPKKEEREHAGVTCFFLPLPLSPWSGSVGTWLGLLQIIPAAMLTGGNWVNHPCVSVLHASLWCGLPTSFFTTHLKNLRVSVGSTDLRARDACQMSWFRL